MISKLIFLLKLIIIFLPFVLFQFLNKRANFKREFRYKQFVIPFFSILCFIVTFGFVGKFYEFIAAASISIEEFLYEENPESIWNTIKGFFAGTGGFIALILICVMVLSLYTFFKKLILLFFRGDFNDDTIRGSIISPFYEYDEEDNRWYLKKSCAQMRKFVKIAYYIVYVLSTLVMFYSFELFQNDKLLAPFCPVLAVIVMGELAFFLDGMTKDEVKGSLVMTKDNSRLVAMYALLRKPLAKLFGDKLASEGTTINVTGYNGGAAEDILANIEKTGGHIGENYVAFMRKKIDLGLFPNVDYLRSGYDLATGKSLLFNTPFYDKLIPYAFYAVNRTLLSGKKVLVVSGRHGTESDLVAWCEKGLLSATNVPDLYNISVLTGKETDEENTFDIGIISRSGVHDLDIHKKNINFLKEVGFVIVVEPSRLVTTAQIGLNLLIKCCGKDNALTFCSLDRNCDGLVDSLSHILMTNITEVSATEYPHGMSSFMCWKADDEYLQHRLFPGVSRYMGLGTELSFVALKNQVKKAIWYGEDMYPVLDAHWISKQYYYDFLRYANLPTTQESFDKHFKTSFNMCNESVSDYSYVTVEDDRKNLFEARRNFATIAENQGFVNVISSEYMLREYMADNTDIFTSDAKAIPYITADYARTKRNSVLSLCLLLCVGNVSEKEIIRKFSLMGIETDDCKTTIWEELCVLFSGSLCDKVDKNGYPVIMVDFPGRDKISFEKDLTIIFKREYSVETGKFENTYTIDSKDFAEILLDDLQNAGYIAEIEGEDHYLGTELKGHVYQKYLPGQLFTLNGKYYEMISTTSDNKIMVRRASEHINGRISYRQVRKYILDKIRNSEDMGALKTVNNIDIHYLFADFEVETDGYWKLKSYNDFENGSNVEINAVPVRKYFNKQILKLDFSKIGELFTDSVRQTLTVLLNEVFVTLFAENQPFISAVTAGECKVPATYSLEIKDDTSDFDNSIFIIEDSQLDIGLLVAVERNLDRILQIISDYLLWNQDKIDGKIPVTYRPVQIVTPPVEEVGDAEEGATEEAAATPSEEQAPQEEKENTESSPEEVVKAPSEDTAEKPENPQAPIEPAPVQEEKPAKSNVFSKMSGKFKSIFKKKKNAVEEENGSGEKVETSQDSTQTEVTEEAKKDTDATKVESEKEAEVVHSE